VPDDIPRVALLKPLEHLWRGHRGVEPSTNHGCIRICKDLVLARVLAKEGNLTSGDVIDATLDLKLISPNSLLHHRARLQELLHAVEHIQFNGVLDLVRCLRPVQGLQSFCSRCLDVAHDNAKIARQILSWIYPILGTTHCRRHGTALRVAQNHEDRALQVLDAILSTSDDTTDRRAANVPCDADHKKIAR